MVVVDSMSRGAIRFEQVTKVFGGKPAVEDFSLDIKEGEFYSLVGPSGSGKSTTLMMLSGFVTPSRGDIRIGGSSVIGVPPQKRQLGMMFQSYAVFPHMSVGENVAFPLRVRRVSRADTARRVKAVLDLVQLGSFADRSPGSLSGGQLQRVALARAIVFEPRVLLMDEPLSALDKELRSHMQIELKRIQQELGVTVVYVTHDQAEALSMSDRMAVMNHGRIEQEGTPQQLYQRPESRFVAGFLGESNLIEARVTHISGNRVKAEAAENSVISGWSSQSLSVGDLVTAAIRPEKIMVGGAGNGASNHLRGRVAVVNYGGDFTRYALETDAGVLIVKFPNHAGVSERTIGELLELNWPSEETIFFRKSAP